jgi:hypothetical protein
MQPRARAERRAQLRFPVSWKLQGQELSLAGLPQARREAIARGHIQDISLAGMCVVSDQPFRRFQLLRCEIFPSDAPVAIPTLAQVRWTLRAPENHGFRVGVRFLL